MSKETINEKIELEVFNRIKSSPIYFVELFFGKVPQPVKPEHKPELLQIIKTRGDDWEEQKKKIKASWFQGFDKKRHLTWQQYLILLSVEKAAHGEASKKISIASGHGIGKTAVVSWVILWFLFVFYESLVGCTAPTSDQMYDVLWKELAKWIDKLPESVRAEYEWARDHVRMKASPEVWFARAKTSSKENSEALAGLHADHVLTVADEASGVEEAIFNTAEGAWTSGNIIVILISNPTRTNGYFYDTHHKLKKYWQCLQFSSMESPVVDHEYEAQIAERHGRDSVEYGIRVLGKFPAEDAMDDSGYIGLLNEKNINERPDLGDLVMFSTTSILGVDPAGDGDDKTSWILRDQFKAKKIAEESKSTSKTIAEKTITLIEHYGLEPRNVVVDAFGVGKDVGKEIAIATRGEMNVTTVNTGDPSVKQKDRDLYLNKRAEAFYKLKQWMQSGGEIIENKNLREELLSIKYKRNLKGKIQIMPKVEMKKRYGAKSPNDADAFSLTFLRNIPDLTIEQQKKRQGEREEQEELDGDFDRFSPIPSM